MDRSKQFKRLIHNLRENRHAKLGIGGARPGIEDRAARQDSPVSPSVEHAGREKRWRQIELIESVVLDDGS